ncbi:uncharacterized protein BDV17DRAFT_290169 [Aspergillus undulatus]|uniref:uncharacterized protein n=1 Tax=Aspergillus undulatus TaxID=1810928 RepID=UPI003CCCAA43
MPTISWTTLAGVLLLSPFAASLPLPTKENASSPNLEPRSPMPVPGPRMIPSQTDLISEIFARLGMEELDKFNKLHPDEDETNEPTVVDDSKSDTVTVTTHYNNVDAGRGAGTVEGQKQRQEPKQEPGVKSEEHSDTDTDSDADTDTGKKGKDAAEDPQGFVDTLFEVLRKKFREAINGSDEVSLR